MEREPTTRTRTQQKETESTLLPGASKHAQHALLQLKHALGKQAFGKFIQAKLKISQPGDVYEQKANHVADRVIRMPDAVREPG